MHQLKNNGRISNFLCYKINYNMYCLTEVIGSTLMISNLTHMISINDIESLKLNEQQSLGK